MGVVPGVCAELVPRRLALPSEDTVHRCLAAALGAAAAAILLVRGPTEAYPGTSGAPEASTLSAAEVTRPELDATIGLLQGWLEQRAGAPHTPLEANLRLLSLGRAALDPSAGEGSELLLANLQRLAATEPAAQPAALPSPPADWAADGADATPLASLAILLEAGTPLERELPLAAGPTRVARLLELALAQLEARRDRIDPWTLDLLSFSVLGGQRERRDELARRAHAGLTRLDREQRLVLGTGDAAARELRRSLGADIPPNELPRRGQLHLAASIFRAVAVLGEPELEPLALRQLNALVQRQRLERDAYRTLLAEAPDEAARVRIHIDALENLGRLEQALYGAHVAFRRGGDRPGPAPRTASSMRRAASELLEHVNALRRAAVLDTAAGTARPPAELLRAVAHALRGLRASRIAT
jgi:hypothetical protein